MLIALISGLLFAFGLGFGGMLNPSNVQGFLNVFGEWKPDLIFVLASAIPTYYLFVLFSQKMKKPVNAESWNHLPKVGWDIRKSTLVGSALFGVGWGLSGFCPGPAIVSIISGKWEVLLFSASMFLGFAFFEKTKHVFRME
jgi:uncharacterized protein